MKSRRTKFRRVDRREQPEPSKVSGRQVTLAASRQRPDGRTRIAGAARADCIEHAVPAMAGVSERERAESTGSPSRSSRSHDRFRRRGTGTVIEPRSGRRSKSPRRTTRLRRHMVAEASRYSRSQRNTAQHRRTARTPGESRGETALRSRRTSNSHHQGSERLCANGTPQHLLTRHSRTPLIPANACATKRDKWSSVRDIFASCFPLALQALAFGGNTA